LFEKPEEHLPVFLFCIKKELYWLVIIGFHDVFAAQEF